MGLDVFLALMGFAFVTVITPGPNNLMLMVSGANFGFRRTLPHMLGIGIGFPAMVALVGVGALRLFEAWPAARTGLAVLCGVYLLYLAWKIAQATPPDGTRAAGRPLTFWQAAAFQWVNPKAWTMALSAITLYAGTREVQAVLLVAGVYVVVSGVSTASWTLLGLRIGQVLHSPRRLRWFNRAMAVLLLASVLPVLAPAAG